MFEFLTAKVLSAVAVTALGSYAAVGAFAAPEATPWPDPFQPQEVAQETENPSQEGLTEELEENGVEENAEDLGVPTDSPACEQVGCRDVETADGDTLHLPDPAADGIEAADQHRQDAQDRADEARDNAQDPPVPTALPSGNPTDHGENEVEENRVDPGLPEEAGDSLTDIPTGRP